MLKIALIDRTFFFAKSFKIVDIHLVAIMADDSKQQELACMLDHVTVADPDEYSSLN